jgi:hypothetical protein
LWQDNHHNTYYEMLKQLEYDVFLTTLARADQEGMANEHDKQLALGIDKWT